MRLTLTLALLLCACGRFGFGVVDDGGPSADGVGADGPAADAVNPGPFGQGAWQLGTVQRVSELSSSTTDGPACLTNDGVTLYLTVKPDNGERDTFIYRRPNRDAPFAEVGPVDGVNTAYIDELRTLDGLTGFLVTDRPGGTGQTDIWIGTRPSLSTPWDSSMFAPLGINTVNNDWDPVPTPDLLQLYYAPSSPAGQRIAVATRASTADPFGAPQDVQGIGEGAADPSLSPDGRVLLFTSSRAGGQGGRDLWYAVRSVSGFSQPENLTALNSAHQDAEPCISPDGTELFFSSNRSGNTDIYRVAILAGP